MGEFSPFPNKSVHLSSVEIKDLQVTQVSKQLQTITSSFSLFNSKIDYFIKIFFSLAEGIKPDFHIKSYN